MGSRIDLATIPVLQGLLKQRLETCTAEKDAAQVSLEKKKQIYLVFLNKAFHPFFFFVLFFFFFFFFDTFLTLFFTLTLSLTFLFLSFFYFIRPSMIHQ